MRALDTNILARFILGDDPIQSPRAATLIEEPCFVSVSVLLETAWLLSSYYAIDRPQLAELLVSLVALPKLIVADAELVEWAIERFANGADLADMLHLIEAMPATTFATFDKKLARLAGPDAPVRIETIA